MVFGSPTTGPAIASANHGSGQTQVLRFASHFGSGALFSSGITSLCGGAPACCLLQPCNTLPLSNAQAADLHRIYGTLPPLRFIQPGLVLNLHEQFSERTFAHDPT